MNIIMFRAKRIFDGTIGSDETWIFDSNIRISYEHKRVNLKGLECQFNTLGQYIGVQDINGKNIFVGDLVKCVSKVDFEFGEKGMTMTDEVSFNRGAFYVKGYFSVLNWDEFSAEVVSNIYTYTGENTEEGVAF